MRIDIWQDEHNGYFQIIDHDAKMELKIYADGHMSRNNGPIFGVCGSDKYVSWATLTEATGYSRDEILEHFKLGVKDF